MNVEFLSFQNQQDSQPAGSSTRCTRSAVKPQPTGTNVEKISKKIESKTTVEQKVKTGSKQRQFKCPMCKKSFPDKKSCELHRNVHQNKCDLCKETFDKLSNHVCKHDRKTGESERYQCNVCQVSFVDLNDLDSHVRQHFDTDVRYKCNICETFCFDVDHLVKHTKLVHDEIATTITFDCYVCGNLFTSIDDFVKHDNLHKKQSGSFNCSDCGDTFPSLLSLNSHRKTHTVRTQPYACQKCTLRFSRSEDLHNHVRVHDGKSIYSCALCDRMFAHSKNLTNHVHKSHRTCFAADEMDLIDFVVEAEVAAQVDRKKMEKNVGSDDVPLEGDVFELNVKELVTKYMAKEIPSSTPLLQLLSIEDPSLLPMNTTRKLSKFFRKFKCPLCKLAFAFIKTLEIHCKRNHHGNYTLDQIKDVQKAVDQNPSESFPRAILNTRRVNVAPKHECPSCNQTYESRQELIEHLKVDHDGNTPYKCVECKEKFADSNALAVHVVNHPVKRHECKYCRLTFMNLYSLGKHTKRHEGNFFVRSNETLDRILAFQAQTRKAVPFVIFRIARKKIWSSICEFMPMERLTKFIRASEIFEIEIFLCSHINARTVTKGSLSHVIDKSI